MVDSSRKHGAFDRRYPALPKLAASTWETRPGENDQEQLDWSAFLERFFPHRRRHDHEALAAYEAYRNRLAQGSPDQTSATWQSRRVRRRSRPKLLVARVGSSLVSEGSGRCGSTD
jgi:hypothetical protein